MPPAKAKAERLNLAISPSLKARLRTYADQQSRLAGHFISMQACVLQLVTQHVPPAPGETDIKGKKRPLRALRSTG